MFQLKFRPKLWTVIQECLIPSQLGKDLLAGVTVGLMAVPLAIGFGIASIPVDTGIPGLSPASMGLYTAIIAGFLISAFGGSRVQIGGPTGAFIPVVAAIVLRHGLEGLWLATFLAGLMLIALGLFRAGTLSRFIPLPVVIGFTSGIAVIIGLQQIKDFLGIIYKPAHAGTIEYVTGLIQAIGQSHINWPTLLVSLGGLVFIFLIPSKWHPRVVVMFVGTLVVTLLGLNTLPGHPGIATIGSTFGKAVNGNFVDAIPSGLPAFIPLKFHWSLFQDILPDAVVIALLGAIESILAAMATDKVIKDRHDPDQELLAQGIANCVVPWFGGIPVTGAIARGSVNVQSGGRTPISGMVHAVFLLCVVLFAAKWIAYVPLCILAVILIHVAIKMFEYHQLIELRQVTKGELAIACVTFALTVLVDLNSGVMFGLVTGAIIMLWRLKETSVMQVASPESTTGANSIHGHNIPDDVLIFRIEGVFFYAVADDLEGEVEEAIAKRPNTRVVIFRLGKMLSIDYHGLLALEGILKSLRKRGIETIICDAQPHPNQMMYRHGFLDVLGLDNLCGNIAHSLARAEVIRKVPRGSFL